MSELVNRRTFLASAAVAAAFANPARAMEPSRIRLGVIGVGGRGTDHARSFAKISDVSVTAVCDVDEGRAAKAAAAVGKDVGMEPKPIFDFRKILDDKEIDAVTIATC